MLIVVVDVDVVVSAETAMGTPVLTAMTSPNRVSADRDRQGEGFFTDRFYVTANGSSRRPGA